MIKKNNFKLCSITLFLFLLTFLSYGQNRIQLERVELLKKQDTRLIVRWNKTQLVPKLIRGNLTKPNLRKSPEEIAKGFLRENSELWKSNDISENLSLLKIDTTKKRNWTHIKYQQKYNSIPVEGFQLIVHMNEKKELKVINGNYLPNIRINTNATFDRSRVLGIVEKDLKVTKDKIENTPQIGLVIYSDNGTPKLAYKTMVRIYNPVGEFVYFVDANTGEILNKYNDLQFCLNRETHNANNSFNLPGTIEREEDGLPTSDNSINDAHNHAGLVYIFYNNQFGRCSYDDAGATIISSVHVGNNWNNAAWSSGLQQMFYGDGDGVLFSPLAQSLDIVAHEITHAVTNSESSLVYQNESGALNESISDIFGVLIDPDDWLIGEDVYTPNQDGDALRYLDNPNLGSQPDHMDDFATPDASGNVYDRLCDSYPDDDNGCVHINSGIPNKAAYLMMAGGTHHGISVNRIGMEKVGQIFYETQVNWLTANSNFADARDATLDAVSALGLGSDVYASVQDAWAAVGIGNPSIFFDPQEFRDLADILWSILKKGIPKPCLVDGCPNPWNPDIYKLFEQGKEIQTRLPVELSNDPALKIFNYYVIQPDNSIRFEKKIENELLKFKKGKLQRKKLSTLNKMGWKKLKCIKKK